MGRKVRNKETKPRPTRKTTEDFIQKANILHNFKYNYHKTIYVLNNIPVIVICPIHGEFETIPQNHIKIHKNKKWKPTGCPKCGKELVIERNKAGKLSHNMFLEKANTVHNFRYEYPEECSRYHDKMKIKCMIHGLFLQTVSNHLRGSGCPKCKNSKGSTKIAKILTAMNINYIPEHSYDDCRGDKNKLYFDFYLPDLNTLIEYDGEQHFKPVKFNNKMTDEQAQMIFDRNKKYDSIKNDYCHINNIKLIRIPYFERDIKNYLSQNLKIED